MYDEYIKICLNCGDRLLAQAKKCPFCGEKAKSFPLVNRDDQDKIEETINSVPNPKNGKEGKWVQNLEDKAKIWNNTSQKKKGLITERKQKAQEDGIAHCPKCGSTSISAQKKGGSIFKALIGGAIIGPIGLLAGGIGRNKMNLYCMKCGNKFRT